MKSLLSLIIFLIFSLQTVSAHPIKVSVVNAKIISDKKITVSVKVTKHDLDVCLFHNYQYHADSMKSEKEFNKYVRQYFSYALQILSCDSLLLKRDFGAIHIKKEDVLINMTFYLPESCSFFAFQNRIFLDTFMDQRNLMIVSGEKNEEGYEFDRRHITQTINLSNFMHE